MKHLLLILIATIIPSAIIFAQSTTISGIVIDEPSGQPIPYATIAIMSPTTNKILAGTTSKDDGSFNVTTDSSAFIIEVRFIGFITKKIETFDIIDGKINLGKILLSNTEHSLDQVQVTAEKSSVEFKLDKRVFNVGSDLTSSGMGAMDLLNNVPSVNVDIEGIISLRGNSGVQILINGKPSVLSDEGSNALGTISADMIESIEVITNPSAKYEAEGSAGIINIILKKEDKKAFNGSISLNTGYPNNHSIGVSLNQRTEKFNLFAQLGAGYRTRPTIRKTENINHITGSEIYGLGEESKSENFYNVILGTDIYLNDFNTITVSGNYMYEIEDEPTITTFSLENEGYLLSQYTRTGATSATNPKYQFDVQYAKQFKNHKDHNLLFSTTGNFFGKKQTSEYINENTLGFSAPDNQRIETDFYQSNYAFKLDYTNPITKKITIETGGIYELNNVGNEYSVLDQSSDVWALNTNLSNDFNFDQKVLGLYGTASYEAEKWGVKAGLRFENTDVQTLLATTNESNSMNYTNLFPSAHVSYKISKQYSLQAGYSKRIYRPRMWDLNPFFNIQNTYSVRKGNPELMPEFADSYEITGIFIKEKISLNASVYFLHTVDVIERVSFFEDDINTVTPTNIGTRDQLGIELNAKYSPNKWLTLSGDFNYGYFNRVGTFEDQVFDFNGDKWSSKLTAKIKLPADIEVELSGNQESRYATVQGVNSGFVYGNIGLRKKLWKGKGVINASVQDVFASRIRESIVDQPDYYLYNYGQRGRFFTIGFSYSFGKGEAMTYSGKRR
ncbi:outer membrane beta-barrel family protein [Crocinitomix catalasitica]|uniref:outer membrane beta-barrel family protein n=1 Tax=Crocinitomix catalasitica TaxID=184607 RepID=UPI0004827C22|nr:outer membrane beta-barrel family protein [Crocinitomix catalasitica]